MQRCIKWNYKRLIDVRSMHAEDTNWRSISDAGQCLHFWAHACEWNPMMIWTMIAHGRRSRHFCFSFVADFRLRSTDCKRMIRNISSLAIRKIQYPVLDRAAVCTEIRCRRRLLSTTQWLCAQFIQFDRSDNNNKISVYDRAKCIACSQECVPGYWQLAPRGAHNYSCIYYVDLRHTNNKNDK